MQNIYFLNRDASYQRTNIAPIYGWSEKGNRAYGEVRGYRKDRRSIIAGYTPGSKQLIAPMEYHGLPIVNYLISG